MPNRSTLAPLESPVFRMLWLAWLAVNITMWTNDAAAAWLMTTLTDSMTMVALVSAASTLPVFLLGLPSGALADILDRRRYFAGTQLWVATVAIVLAVTTVMNFMSAPLLLGLTCANGVGLALRWPVFAAIVPEVVPKKLLPQALALNGVAMNLSRIIGPVFAGVVLASAGAAWVFVLNALLSMTAFVLILRWRSQPRAPGALPGERFVGAMRVGLQHVLQSPPMRQILVRIFLFFLQTAALTSLLPLLARGIGGVEAGARLYTALLACQGVGAVAVVLALPRWRERMSHSFLIRTGPLIHAALTLGIAFAPHPALACAGMVFAGMAWIAGGNTLTVSAQMALPDWVRARGMAIYQMCLMGGTAVGAMVWGQVAGHTSVRMALVASVAFGALVQLLLRLWPLASEASHKTSPAAPTGTLPDPAGQIDPSAGPVMVTMEYQIDPLRAKEFMALMQLTRQARLRQGALSWGLFQDASLPGTYIEYFVDESWLEHLRRHERFTAGDVELREQRLAFHIGEAPPVVRRYVAAQGKA